MGPGTPLGFCPTLEVHLLTDNLLVVEKRKRGTLNQTAPPIYIEKGIYPSIGVMPSVTPIPSESARTKEDLISSYLFKNSRMNELAQVGASLGPLKWPEFIRELLRMGIFPTPDEIKAFGELFTSTLKGAVAEMNRGAISNSQGLKAVVRNPHHSGLETSTWQGNDSSVQEFLENSAGWRMDSFGFEVLHSSKAPFAVSKFLRTHQKPVTGYLLPPKVIRYRIGPFEYFLNNLGDVFRNRAETSAHELFEARHK